jgi:type IV pilus assembly protein PilX
MYGAQRGATLYVALIILLLLSILGVIGLQVAGMQEKMASNYRQSSISFQRAETHAREAESLLAAEVAATGVFRADQEACDPIFDPARWSFNRDGLRPLPGAIAIHTRRIDKCFGASSLKLGEKENEDTGNIYGVSAVADTGQADESSISAIDTIYIP